MPLLSTIIDEPPQLHQPFLVLQSSVAQSSLPLLHHLLTRSLRFNNTNLLTRCLLFCFIYPPSSLLESGTPHSDRLEIHDWLRRIPGLDDNWPDPREEILSSVKDVPPGRLNVIIDSLDTLSSDVGSVSETYNFLHDLLSVIRARSSPSRLIVHGVQPSKLIPLLIPTAFSPFLTHLIAHPPILLTHLAKDYLTPPPPASPEAKFWGVFLPVSDRVYESERLIFGTGGEGSGGNTELVVEVLVRGVNSSRGKRGVERVLEGWSTAHAGPCDLMMLDSLRNMRHKKVIDKDTPDPTQNLPFNLTLTSSQQRSRAQVPLPYVHEGKPSFKRNSAQTVILYDPDSADDIDDDDPDEDLDI